MLEVVRCVLHLQQHEIYSVYTIYKLIILLGAFWQCLLACLAVPPCDLLPLRPNCKRGADVAFALGSFVCGKREGRGSWPECEVHLMQLAAQSALCEASHLIQLISQLGHQQQQQQQQKAVRVFFPGLFSLFSFYAACDEHFR